MTKKMLLLLGVVLGVAATAVARGDDEQTVLERMRSKEHDAALRNFAATLKKNTDLINSNGYWEVGANNWAKLHDAEEKLKHEAQRELEHGLVKRMEEELKRPNADLAEIAAAAMTKILWYESRAATPQFRCGPQKRVLEVHARHMLGEHIPIYALWMIYYGALSISDKGQETVKKTLGLTELGENPQIRARLELNGLNACIKQGDSKNACKGVFDKLFRGTDEEVRDYFSKMYEQSIKNGTIEEGGCFDERR